MTRQSFHTKVFRNRITYGNVSNASEVVGTVRNTKNCNSILFFEFPNDTSVKANVLSPVCRMASPA